MRKIFFSIISIFIVLPSFAQSIYKNDIDKFTKTQEVETTFEKFATSLFVKVDGPKKEISIAMGKKNGTEYIRFRWYCNYELKMKEGSPIILIDSDGEQYVLHNSAFAYSDYGLMFQNKLKGTDSQAIDIYAYGNFDALIDKRITDIRFCTEQGNFDYDVNKKAQKLISDSYELLKSVEI